MKGRQTDAIGVTGGVRTLTAAVLLVVAWAVAATFPAAASAKPKAKRSGNLAIRVAGLPRTDRASVMVVGPKGAARTKRRVSRVGTVRLHNLPAGAYRIRVNKVKLRHRTGKIKRGAVATPVKRRLKVRVKPRRTSSITVRYGTIVNPGLRTISGHISKVIGDPQSPAAVKLDSRLPVRSGQILSARPSGQLPQGLLAHVTSIRRTRRGSVARLRPAGIYEVAPNMDFRTPVKLDTAAHSSAALTCQTKGRSPGVRPYVRVSNAWVSGGWTTTRVAFWDVKTGASVDLHFRTAAGIEVSVDAGASCSLPLPAVGFQGMAGPIPVYGAIRPGAKAQVSGGAKMTAEGSTNVTLGAAIGGVPPSASPHVSFDSPRFSLKSEVFASASAGLSIDAEMGVGVANAANLHVTLGNSLNFTAAPGNCSWDLDLGTFSAGGQLGPLSISSPSSPPLYHRNLWNHSCGAAPPPPPPPAPTISLPFARATMGWNTDSDIDLYAWDQYGNLIAYYERFGIADAELVEDVIPEFGESAHAPEIFQETSNPGRTYTFGICVFDGPGGDVTLDVTDPDGGQRSFHRSFFEPGESSVVTTSPDGSGYYPGPEWCSYASEYEEEFYE